MELIPIFPLELVLLPGEPLPLHIFEPRYKEMIGECMSEQKPFGVVRAKDNGIVSIGCTAEILEITRRYDDGRLDIRAAGRRRFEIVTTNEERSFLQAEVKVQEDEADRPGSDKVHRVLSLHGEVVQLLGPNEGYELPESGTPQLSYELASTLPIDLDFKQTLLTMRSEPDRLTALIEFYQQVLPKLRRALEARKKAGGNGRVG